MAFGFRNSRLRTSWFWVATLHYFTMEGGGQGVRGQTRDTEFVGSPDGSLSPRQPAKFAAYQNPALSAALTATSLYPSSSTFLLFFSLSSASAILLIAITYRENAIITRFKHYYLSESVSYLLAKLFQAVIGLAFLGTSSALIKVIAIRRIRISSGAPAVDLHNAVKDKAFLTNHQLALLGIQPKTETIVSESSKKPPKSKSHVASASSDPLVPLHQPTGGSIRPSRIGSERTSASGGKRTQSFGTPSKSPGSPSSPYLVASVSSHLQSVQSSPSLEQSPWSNKRVSPAREITTEEELERFLADVDMKIMESADKLATPPTTRNGFGVASPSTMPSSSNTSGTTRAASLRPVRLSPASQRFSTPPKKEGELPSPMSMEELKEAFEELGIYPQIEEWRDSLRQWFSSVLLGPLLGKIETSHIQVMQMAAKLGISININQVGADLPTTGTATSVSPIDHSMEWQPAFALDEDAVLQQLRTFLIQAMDASTQRSPFTNLQQSLQQNTSLHIIRECVDAIAEHQRLHTLMKGELIKGLLPQSSISEEYAVQRIRELAEGSCCKNYEYMRSGEVYDKVKKKWTLELPTDSHLLLYLFCAFLEYPKWMLHVDPSSFSGAQSCKYPLFLGVLPSKERFPEKYLAVIPFVPSNLHPGACVLATGRENPPIFALYWDKKPQFSLQGRTALWDSILLLCHRIKTRYGGFVRGLHLGSSAISILPVLESEVV